MTERVLTGLVAVVLSVSGCASSTPVDAPHSRDADASVPPSPLPDAGAGPAADSGMPTLPPSEPFTGCAGSSESHATFNAFFDAFDREYALFDVRLPDASWDDVAREGCARMSEEITGDALFDLLLDMARRLDDGHVTLLADDLGREEDAWVSVYPHLDAVEQLEGVVEEQYLDEELTWAADDWFAWGRIGDIGYLSITSMDELSPSGDDEEADIAAAAAAMSAAVADLADTRAMIVDVRANGGGWDTVALEVAAWFEGAATIAWREQRRSGPGRLDFGPMEPWYVEATRAGGYGGEVLLLTSGATFSAAETFALAMRVRARVRIVGEPSSGHFSDMLDAELPNGWELTLSGERYYAADGMLYETRGVPVDVPVVLDPAALARGVDNVLEAALAELGAAP